MYVLPILSVNAFWFLAWDHVYCVLLLAVLLGVNHTDLITKPALMLSERILAHDPSSYRPPTHLNCHCVDLVRSHNILDFVFYIPRQVAGRGDRDLDGLSDVPLQVPWRSVIYPYSPSIFHDFFPFPVPYLSTRCNVILYLMYLAITPLRLCHLYYSLYPDTIIE